VLEEISADHPEITFGLSPPRAGTLSLAGRGFRLMLDFIRYLEPSYAGAAKPRARMTGRIPNPLRSALAPILRSPRGRAWTRAVLTLADEGVPVDSEVERFMRSFAPEAVVVTPLVDPGSPQTDYVRCAGKLGIPSVLAVHSWDNLTLKGGIHALPDRVAVWNHAQREEAVHLHGVPGDRVVITGAVAYDHWFDWRPSTSRPAFCGAVGLDPDRPFILYLGSSRFIAPDESDFFREWNQRIRKESPELANVQVLLRPHPLNPFSGPVPENVRLAPVSPAEPADPTSRAAYFDALHHSAAVMGVLTSGLIEAAIVDRPVHTLLVDRYRSVQDATVHFGYLLPENGGMLIVADDYLEHAGLLARSLQGDRSSRNRPFVDSFVRPPLPAVSASSVLADSIEELMGTKTAVPARSPRRRVVAVALAYSGASVLRVLLLLRGVSAPPMRMER